MSTHTNVTLDTTLSWAVPVRIDNLVAHLEAYIETLPTIIALRLCSKFGTRPEYHINKLLVELISTIETFVVEPARVEARKTSSNDFKCFELKCDIIDDHFSHEDQHRLYHHATLSVCFGDDHCPLGRIIDPKAVAKRRATLVDHAEDSSSWTDAHDTRTRRWMKKVDTDRPTCIFNEHHELVRNHFGIDVWTSNVRLPPLSAPSAADKWKRGEPQDTTVAYMTLPDNVSSREDWLSNVLDHGNLQSGYAIPVKLRTVPSEASLRRFPRAMSILGLELFIHPKQKGTAISPPPDQQSLDITDEADGSATDWPQLALLTRSRIRRQ